MRFISSFILLLAASHPLSARAAVSPGADVVRASASLIQRVVPGQARYFLVEQIPTEGGLDVFEVESRGERIVLRGSSGVAIASALNWYLEHVAGITIANPLRPLVLSTPLKPVPLKVRISTPYRYRYFFNYCTFSYSMAWWDWDAVAAHDRLDGDEGDQPAARRHGQEGPGGWCSGPGLQRQKIATISSSAPRTSPGAGWVTSTASEGRSPNTGSTPTWSWSGRFWSASVSWG